jgi:hypothetical protein
MGFWVNYLAYKSFFLIQLLPPVFKNKEEYRVFQKSDFRETRYVRLIHSHYANLKAKNPPYKTHTLHFSTCKLSASTGASYSYSSASAGR